MAQTDKRDNRVIAVALLVAAVIVAVGGISSYAAKYAHQESKDGDAFSPAFYFTSDVLAAGTSVPTYDLPVGTTSISFELRNYDDDLRWADTNIDYDYQVWGPDGQIVKKDSGVLTRDASKGVSNTITIDGLTTPGTYKVSAVSSKPFSQSLSADFNIASGDTDVHYKVEDSAGSAYATLTVWTADYKGNVQVSWPAGLVPDQTQKEFERVNTGTSDSTGTSGGYSAGNVTVDASKFSSYTFRFFKTDPSQKYDTSQITAAKAQ